VTVDSLLGRLTALILFGVVSVMAVIWISWLADRSDPARIVNREILTPIVPPGGELVLSVDVDRVRYCKVSVQRFLIDGERTRHVLSTLYREISGKLGKEHYNIVVGVPASAAPGDAIYQTIATYNCNPLNTYWPIVIPAPEVHFKIEAP